jgi:group I intron endonuclease
VKTSGIYVIQNMIDGHCYVGSSKDVKARIKAHKHMLRHGKHHAIRLQRAWDRDGETVFEFYVIRDNVPPDQLLVVEQQLIDEINTEYNMSRVAGTREGVPQPPHVAERLSALFKGRTKTAEHRRKIGEAHKGRERSPEMREKIAAGLREYYSEHPEVIDAQRAQRKGRTSTFKGKRHTEQAKAALSEIAKSRLETADGKAHHALMVEHARAANTGRPGPWKGRKFSDEARAKMSANSGSRKLSQEQKAEMRRLYTEDGVKQKDLAEKYGVAQCTVSTMMRGLTRKQD